MIIGNNGYDKNKYVHNEDMNHNKKRIRILIIKVITLILRKVMIIMMIIIKINKIIIMIN